MKDGTESFFENIVIKKAHLASLSKLDGETCNRK